VLQLCICSAVLADKIIYVDDDANGLNNGTSWTNAYKFLQGALADANSAVKPVEIRVAAGIYKPDRSSAEPNGTGDRQATFRLVNGVTIKGGYAGFGTLDPNVRDIEKYETVLSGDLAGNDIDVNDPCDLLKEPSRAENSYHVINSSKTDRSAVLEGFTISGGNASVKPFHPIPDFEPDGVGGGMFNFGGAPSLIKCRFICNSASQAGGGLYNDSGSNPKLTDCAFSGNCVLGGGGAIVNGPYTGITQVGCVFKGNRAWAGGAIADLYVKDATLIGCVFSDNFAEWAGGGMYNAVSYSGKSMLVNCIFRQNSAEEGGGVYSDHGSPTLLNCMFSGNSGAQGGGVYCDSGSARITNCIFTSNTAKNKGGGMYNDAYSSPGVANCTFAGNSAPNGNALACDSFKQWFPSSPHVSNCILWNGGNEIWNNDGSKVTVTYSDVQGGKMGVYDPCDGLVWGAGNIDVDPCFADANNKDFHLKSQAGRWDPLTADWVQDDATSPCIDAGDPASPIGLEPFPNGGIINMGAYGGTIEASKSYFGEPVCETIVAGDINGDCRVDFKDFAFMAFHWLEDNSP
jgi:hypothetical protein